MLQGTGSDVGKSTLLAGLARVFTRQGLTVAPFKPQNMSNNAAVTADGGEIGRAQALQAQACGLRPATDMNPVLLKPQGGNGSQIVVQGRIWGEANARDYQTIKSQLMPAVLESFGRLAANADLVLIEGAGSASEINLRQNDIANMGFARAVGAPVILIGDIDRGGVIASLVGTKAVLAADDAALIEGFIVNRMRGDPSLFSDGMRLIAERTGWKALGLVPFFDRMNELPAEDSLGLASSSRKPDATVQIIVLAYPHISNFDDFDPLLAEDDVELTMLRPGTPIPGDSDLVILPGSKATIADLAALRGTGWDIDLKAHHRRGGRILGVCGGYQMLGAEIADPAGMEGPAGAVEGLGFLDVETVLGGDKTLDDVRGTFGTGVPFAGYEMHIGTTRGAAAQRPMLSLADGRGEGAVSMDSLVSGCYVHGLFNEGTFRRAFLASLGATSNAANQHARVEAALDALANHLEAHIDCDALLTIARPPAP